MTARRLAVLALARAKRFAIIEDDYNHEFHYDGRPVLLLLIRALPLQRIERRRAPRGQEAGRERGQQRNGERDTERRAVDG